MDITIHIDDKYLPVILIVVALVTGLSLAYIVTNRVEIDEPIVHHVTMGKAGITGNNNTWVSEYYRGVEIFNYTMPYGAVYSWFVSYADVFTVAVPSYSQNFQLERQSGDFFVYVPDLEESVPIEELEERVDDNTILDDTYKMLQYGIRDVRVLAKIHEKPFGICGVITKVLDSGSIIRLGFVLNVDDELWAVVLNEDGRVIHLEEITITVN